MEQNDILKILTHKSGHFVFSARFDTRVAEKRLIEADTILRMLRSLPVPAQVSESFSNAFIRRSILGTAAIEGNPLQEEDVERIVSAGGDFVPANNREREILNLKRAYSIWLDISQEIPDRLLTESIIQEIHKTVMDGIASSDNTPGQYRNIRVEVGDVEHGGKYVQPKILEDIKTLMAAFMEWMNRPEVLSLHPVIRAGLAHYHLGLIHPFRDGNGRVARLVEAYILGTSGWKYSGILLSSYYNNNIDRYYTAFRTCEKETNYSINDFINFVIDGVLYSLEEMKSTIIKSISLSEIRAHTTSLLEKRKINARQRDLVYTLLEIDLDVSIKQLYSSPVFLNIYRNVSEQTARRDIKHLLDLNILRAIEAGYKINLNALMLP